ncbi:10492_t:CDS:1, partial [Rhizophagus irregularis]
VIDSKQKEMIIGNDLLDKWNANINYKEKVLELENDEEIIDIPVWYIKQVEESEESDYESESEESDYEQEEGKKLYTVKEVIKEKEVVEENESQEDSESSSEESPSNDSEMSSENED